MLSTDETFDKSCFAQCDLTLTLTQTLTQWAYWNFYKTIQTNAMQVQIKKIIIIIKQKLKKTLI